MEISDSLRRAIVEAMQAQAARDSGLAVDYWKPNTYSNQYLNNSNFPYSADVSPMRNSHERQADAAFREFQALPSNKAAMERDWNAFIGPMMQGTINRDSPAWQTHRLSENVEDRRDPAAALNDPLTQGWNDIVEGPDQVAPGVAPSGMSHIPVGSGDMTSGGYYTPPTGGLAGLTQEASAKGGVQSSRIQGPISFGGQTYDYGSGGRGYGSIPPGSYPITQYFPAYSRKYGTSNGFPLPSFSLNDDRPIADPRLGNVQGGNRLGILIHPSSYSNDINKILSAGCVAINRDQWPQFVSAVQDGLKQYGKDGLVLDIASDGSASIHPAAHYDGQVVNTSDYLKLNEAGQTPAAASGAVDPLGMVRRTAATDAIDSAGGVMPAHFDANRDAAIRTAYAEDTLHPSVPMSVIYNRTQDKRWPGDALSVVSKGEWQAYNTPLYKSLSPNDPTYQKLGAYYDSLVSGKEKPAIGATYFYSPNAMNGRPAPAWASKEAYVDTIGGQKFYGSVQPRNPAATAYADANAPVTPPDRLGMVKPSAETPAWDAAHGIGFPVAPTTPATFQTSAPPGVSAPANGKPTMWGLPGQSWPGAAKNQQIDAAMAKIADAKGYNYQPINVSGDDKAGQLAAVKAQIKPGDGVVGFSAGAYVAQSLLKDLPAGTVKDAVLMGGPDKVDAPGTTVTAIPSLPGIEHADLPEAVAPHDMTLPTPRPDQPASPGVVASPGISIPADAKQAAVAAGIAPLGSVAGDLVAPTKANVSQLAAGERPVKGAYGEDRVVSALASNNPAAASAAYAGLTEAATKAYFSPAFSKLTADQAKARLKSEIGGYFDQAAKDDPNTAYAIKQNLAKNAALMAAVPEVGRADMMAGLGKVNLTTLPTPRPDTGIPAPVRVASADPSFPASWGAQSQSPVSMGQPSGVALATPYSSMALPTQRPTIASEGSTHPASPIYSGFSEPHPMGQPNGPALTPFVTQPTSRPAYGPALATQQPSSGSSAYLNSPMHSMAPSPVAPYSHYLAEASGEGPPVYSGFHSPIERSTYDTMISHAPSAPPPASLTSSMPSYPQSPVSNNFSVSAVLPQASLTKDVPSYPQSPVSTNLAAPESSYTSPAAGAMAASGLQDYTSPAPAAPYTPDLAFSGFGSKTPIIGTLPPPAAIAAPLNAAVSVGVAGHVGVSPKRPTAAADGSGRVSNGSNGGSGSFPAGGIFLGGSNAFGAYNTNGGGYGGFLRSGYTAPNFTAGSGGSTYPYKSDGNGGGTYYTSSGQTYTYRRGGGIFVSRR